jgi:hypothetical protein
MVHHACLYYEGMASTNVFLEIFSSVEEFFAIGFSTINVFAKSSLLNLLERVSSLDRDAQKIGDYKKQGNTNIGSAFTSVLVVLTG